MEQGRAIGQGAEENGSSAKTVDDGPWTMRHLIIAAICSYNSSVFVA
jgi:hypothetical protein